MPAVDATTLGVEWRADGARVVAVQRRTGVGDVRQVLGPPDAAAVAAACRVVVERCPQRPTAIALAARELPWSAAVDRARAVGDAAGLPCVPVGTGTSALLAHLARIDRGPPRNIALLSLGEALDVGVWVGGRPLHTDGRDPDVNHWPLDPAGERCGCGGRGCATTVLGPAALARTAALAQLPASAGQGGADLAGRAEAGDPMARAVLQRMADDALRFGRALVAAYGITALALHWPTAAERGVVADLLRAAAARRLPAAIAVRVARLNVDGIAEGAGRWAMRRHR
ncbi:MAG: ROK family protein [Deltaproteobacteria bacterium]|nr:ROK family protein [Deltaproteobacteria bacterium]